MTYETQEQRISRLDNELRKERFSHAYGVVNSYLKSRLNNATAKLPIQYRGNSRSTILYKCRDAATCRAFSTLALGNEISIASVKSGIDAFFAMPAWWEHIGFKEGNVTLSRMRDAYSTDIDVATTG